MVERVAHQGLADLGYKAADKPAADRLVAAVGKPAAVVGRLAAVARKHAGEPQPLLADDELLLLVRAVCEQPLLADDGLLLPVGVLLLLLARAVCGQPLQRGRVVSGFVLRFSGRNRGRTCSQY